MNLNYNKGVVPGTDEFADPRPNVTIVIDRHVTIDVANLYVDNLMIEGLFRKILNAI